MKEGGDRGKASGFTIVETLIVLTVSALLLGSAVLLISGKQNITEFQTGITGLQQRFRQIINETTTGYYPGTGNFTCLSSGVGPVQFDTTTSTAQGSNGACVFLGRVLRLGGNAFDPATLTTYPIAGSRLSSSGQIASSFAQLHPTAIAQGNTNNTTGPTLDSQEKFQYGIKLVLTSVGSNPWGAVNGVNPFAISFLADPNIAASGSGSQQFSLYGFSGWTGASNGKQVVDNIDNTPGGSYLSLPSVRLCFASGGTKQSGIITITNGLTVTLQIKGTTTCA